MTFPAYRVLLVSSMCIARLMAISIWLLMALVLGAALFHTISLALRS